MNISYYLFEEMLQEAMETEDEGIVTFSDLEMGSSIEFKGREKKLGKNSFVEAHSVSFKPRDAYGDDILKQTFPLDAMLIIPTYEQVAKVHLGMETDEEGESSEIQEDVKERKGRQQTRTRSRYTEKAPKIPDDEPAEGEGPPWDGCPKEGKEFGDCDPADPDCEVCDEDLFQACAAKQDELKKEADIESIKEGKKDVKKTETGGRSRRRESNSDNKAKTSGRRKRK
jgi:hypothetical protein